MKIEQPVLAVLDAAICAGPALRLQGLLDRKLYERTAKVIELAGGKWNRAANAHIFPDDAAAAIEPVILTGEIVDARQLRGAFYTPADLAQRVVGWADIWRGASVLEPSAGDGALALPAHRASGSPVNCVEIDALAAQHLRSHPMLFVVETDFLKAMPSGSFDRVVMNPPFANGADARHVTHAVGFLRPGGRLVAIMSAAPLFRTTGVYPEFARFLAGYRHTLEALPEGSFKAAGTSVNTAILTLDVPA